VKTLQSSDCPKPRHLAVGYSSSSQAASVQRLPVACLYILCAYNTSFSACTFFRQRLIFQIHFSFFDWGGVCTLRSQRAYRAAPPRAAPGLHPGCIRRTQMLRSLFSPYSSYSLSRHWQHPSHEKQQQHMKS
jgi:hypothetical protein